MFVETITAPAQEFRMERALAAAQRSTCRARGVDRLERRRGTGVRRERVGDGGGRRRLLHRAHPSHRRNRRKTGDNPDPSRGASCGVSQEEIATCLTPPTRRLFHPGCTGQLLITQCRVVDNRRVLTDTPSAPAVVRSSDRIPVSELEYLRAPGQPRGPGFARCEGAASTAGSERTRLGPTRAQKLSGAGGGRGRAAQGSGQTARTPRPPT